jgi:hypothetical protein
MRPTRGPAIERIRHGSPSSIHARPGSSLDPDRNRQWSAIAQNWRVEVADRRGIQWWSGQVSDPAVVIRYRGSRLFVLANPEAAVLATSRARKARPPETSSSPWLTYISGSPELFTMPSPASTDGQTDTEHATGPVSRAHICRSFEVSTPSLNLVTSACDDTDVRVGSATSPSLLSSRGHRIHRLATPSCYMVIQYMDIECRGPRPDSGRLCVVMTHC